MRRLARFGAPILVALAMFAAVPTPGYAAKLHAHKRIHHPAGRKGHTPGPTTSGGQPAASCVATPEQQFLSLTSALAGRFGVSIVCQGLVVGDVMNFAAPRISGGCTSLSFNGGGPTASEPVDLFGRATMAVAGDGCTAGDYSVQVFGLWNSFDVEFTLLN